MRVVLRFATFSYRFPEGERDWIQKEIGRNQEVAWGAVIKPQPDLSLAGLTFYVMVESAPPQ